MTPLRVFHPRRWRFVALTLAALAAPLIATAGIATAAAATTSVGDWFPLRGAHLIGCTYNGTGGSCGGTYHPYWALDIKGTIGEPVYAAGGGTVVDAIADQSGNCDARTRTLDSCGNGERGNSVTIDHGGGNFTYYQHLKSVSVHKGDPISGPNVQIGAVGISGWTYPTFPHLHFERRSARTGSQIDPGPLRGCVGTVLKVYPKDLTPAPAAATWYGLPSEKHTAQSDGTTCGGSSGGGGGGGGDKPKADVVFVIDTTGSMGPYIDAAKASASALAGQLFSKADARVALVDYKDLYLCPSDGYAARVDLPFSTSAAALATALSPLSADGGCDTPESVYSGLMAGIGLPWRNGVTKALVLMGDAPPHDPEPSTGLTLATVAAAAFAVDPAAIYAIDINGGGSPYFEDLARTTGGTSSIATDPASAVSKIAAAITTITSSALTADAGGPYAGVAGASITFNGGASTAPAGASIATYEWDFDGNGTYDVSSASPIASHVYPARFSGKVGLRVTTNQVPAQTATATTTVNVYDPTSVLYGGPRSGRAGQRLRVLSTVTAAKASRVAGLTVTMTLGAASCTAVSDAAGRAQCDLSIPTDLRGPMDLLISVAGNDRYFSSGATERFVVL